MRWPWRRKPEPEQYVMTVPGWLQRQLTPGVWYRITMTRGRRGRVHYYVDGVEVFEDA